MSRRPAMWWTTVKGGRRAARRPWKWTGRRESHRLPLEEQLWWLAQEMRDTADAIGPAPEEAERCLRVLADKAEKAEIEPWGGL